MKKCVAIILILVLSFSNIINAFAAPDNPSLPLGTRIENYYNNLQTLEFEITRLTNQQREIHNTLEEFRKIAEELRNNSLWRIVFLFLQTLNTLRQHLTLSVPEVALLLVEHLTNMDNLFQNTPNDDLGKQFVAIQKFRDELAAMISILENAKFNNTNSISQKENEIETTKGEIARLKALYKSATNMDYVRDRNYTDKLSQTILSFENQTRSTSSCQYDTAYGAANSYFQSMVNNDPDAKFESPIMISQDPYTNRSVFRILKTKGRWDGNFNGYIFQKDYTNETWLNIIASNEGKYCVGDAEGIPAALPNIKTNGSTIEVERGKQIQLKAEVETFDGTPPLQIVWFAKTSIGGVYERVGQGETLNWTVPENNIHLDIDVLAEDRLNNVNYVTAIASTALENDYKSVVSDEMEEKPYPKVMNHGDMVSARLDLYFTNPCDVDVEWSEDSSEGPKIVSPVYKTKNPQGGYIYSTFYTFTANAYDSEGKPLYDKVLYYTVRGKTGSIVRVNYTRGYSIPFSEDIKANYDKQQSVDEKEKALALLAEFNKNVEKYNEEYAKMIKVPDVLGAIWTLNVRANEYIDWRLGKTQAQEGWGVNYTVTLFEEDAKETVASLNTLAGAMNKAGINSSYLTDFNMSYDARMLKTLREVERFFPAIEEYLQKMEGLYKQYEVIRNQFYQLYDYGSKGIITAPGTYPQVIGGTVNSDRLNGVKTNLVSNISRYPISKEENQQSQVTSQSIFSDVSPKDWFYIQVDYLAQKGIVSGSNNKFSPNDIVNRAQFAAIAAKYLKLPLINPIGIEDVKADQWYSPYIGAVISSGAMGGYGSKAFGPNDVLTREQAATIIVRIIEKEKGKTLDKAELPFTDRSNVSSWAIDSVKKAYNIGMIGGKPGSIIAPKDKLSRAEMAVIVYRMAKYLE